MLTSTYLTTSDTAVAIPQNPGFDWQVLLPD
jgi:hypothetical protein